MYWLWEVPPFEAAAVVGVVMVVVVEKRKEEEEGWYFELGSARRLKVFEKLSLPPAPAPPLA